MRIADFKIKLKFQKKIKKSNNLINDINMLKEQIKILENNSNDNSQSNNYNKNIINENNSKIQKKIMNIKILK